MEINEETGNTQSVKRPGRSAKAVSWAGIAKAVRNRKFFFLKKKGFILRGKGKETLTEGGWDLEFKAAVNRINEPIP